MTMGRRVTERPSHPDGTKYEFNCCAAPDVRGQPVDFDDWSEGEPLERKVCESCGHDWTDQLADA